MSSKPFMESGTAAYSLSLPRHTFISSAHFLLAPSTFLPGGCSRIQVCF